MDIYRRFSEYSSSLAVLPISGPAGVGVGGGGGSGIPLYPIFYS